jgi:Meiotically up-regulated gene 113
MNRDHIVSEIQRTATANGGVPFGKRRFEKETGIDRHAWYGKYWTCWSDAVREAGFEPNKLPRAHEPSLLIEKLVALTRSLGRLPVLADLSFARNYDSSFPSRHAFIRRLGYRSERALRVLAFCQQNAGYDDVGAIWRPAATVDSGPLTGSAGASRLVSPPGGSSGDTKEPRTAFGYVYLLKHGTGREYKIGRTRNPLRREGEVSLELPNELQPVHYIKTDDPAGIECYWHDRFKTKRKRGEWFALTANDVRAFRRWKRIH